MESVDLLLAGILGASVRCVKPVFDWSQYGELDDDDLVLYPAIGDLGRVTGVVVEDGLIRVWVSMDDNVEHPEEMSYSKFNDCFASDSSRGRFKPVLR